MPSSHEITDDEQWLAARTQLLAREKELTRLRDEVNALRRALPYRRIERAYTFAGEDGERTLRDLFGDSSQLLVYHFMYGPGWDAGCPSCSFWADHFDPMIPHLLARDTAFAVISRAPFATLRAYAERMGWRFPWYSSNANSFNRDFGVTFTEEQVASKERLYNYGTSGAFAEAPGASAFLRDGDAVLHTYSTYARGLDILNGTYHWLDITAKGRDEAGLPWPMAWLKRHDEYAS
ncbi:MAG: DUF899 domain-containing protein [Myxococcales bacterium]|nr:DUF899 domain-containing protein [Myxococcales bacterium]